MAILIDQCLVQLSLEKLPPAADGSKYRDPQPDIIQILRDFATLSRRWDIAIKSLPAELGEPQRKGGRKNGRARGDGGHKR